MAAGVSYSMYWRLSAAAMMAFSGTQSKACRHAEHLPATVLKSKLTIANLQILPIVANLSVAHHDGDSSDLGS